MSGTTPDMVHAAIDAQSGRFEFFKQALTLGLAAIGGIAVMFTDTGKIPVEYWARFTVSAGGLLALLTVVFALLGIGAYANLLNATAQGKSVDLFEKGMVWHARFAYVLLGCTGTAFLGFAAARLWSGVPPVSVDAALGLGRQAMSTAVGEAGGPVQMDRYDTGDKDVVISYSVGGKADKYTLTIDRAAGRLKSIVRQGK